MSNKIKVAVIGSGLAGLTLSHLLELNHDMCEVHLFEKSNAIGMDKASITVKLDQTTFRLDSPMRSINGGSYKRLLKLYNYLNVNLVESNFSYTFFRIGTNSSTSTANSTLTSNSTISTPSPPPYTPSPILTPLFIYEGSNGLKFPPFAFPSTMTSWIDRGLYSIHLVLITLSYLHLLLLAFMYYFLDLTGSTRTNSVWKQGIINVFGLKPVGKEPLKDFCQNHFLWKDMQEELLYPLFSAVSSVGRSEVVDLPSGEILEYIVGTFGSSHYVTQSGVQQVVKLLTAPLHPSQVHLSSSILSLSSHPTPSNPNSTRIYYEDSSSVPTSMNFDHVVFATQANQAKGLLETMPISKKEVEAKIELERISSLAKFEYVRTLVINHTDSSILPPPIDRRDLNLVTYPLSSTSTYIPSPFVNSSSEKDLDLLLPNSSIQATHIISRTHPHLVKTLPSSMLLLQTTNPIVKIQDDLILSSAWFERIKVSIGSKEVIGKFIIPESNNDEGLINGGGELQGVNNIWFVGSWCSEGLPLLEGCVISAERVAKAIIEKEGEKGRKFEVPY